MSLQIIHSMNLPYQWPVDPSSEFQPGQVAQLGTHGLNIVCGVSDGRFPLGIIDDCKTTSFTRPSIKEAVSTPLIEGILDDANRLVSPTDIVVELNNPLISVDSFISYDVPVELNSKNGTVTFLAGTPLNYSLTSGGTPNAIRTFVSYTYQVPNVFGDDTTFASRLVTVYYGPFIGSTSIFDTSAYYSLNAPLFVNQNDLLTTKCIDPSSYPAVAQVIGPPGGIHDDTLMFKWFI